MYYHVDGWGCLVDFSVKAMAPLLPQFGNLCLNRISFTYDISSWKELQCTCHALWRVLPSIAPRTETVARLNYVCTTHEKITIDVIDASNYEHAQKDISCVPSTKTLPTTCVFQLRALPKPYNHAILQTKSLLLRRQAMASFLSF